MIYFLVLIIFALLSLLILSVRKSLSLQDKIENISDSLDNSLDVLDLVFNRIVEKTQLEVLSDDPVVRELAQDLRLARDAVQSVAILLTSQDNNKVSEGD